MDNDGLHKSNPTDLLNPTTRLPLSESSSETSLNHSTDNAELVNQPESQLLPNLSDGSGVSKKSPNKITDRFKNAFSNLYGVVFFIFGLKWYMILLIILIVSLVLIQYDIFMENRKKTKSKDKSTKSIIRKSGVEVEGFSEKAIHTRSKGKTVTFQSPRLSLGRSYSFLSEIRKKTSENITRTKDMLRHTYNFLIVPHLYAFTRSVGLR